MEPGCEHLNGGNEVLLTVQLSEVEEAPGKGIQQQGAQGQASRYFAASGLHAAQHARLTVA